MHRRVLATASLCCFFGGAGQEAITTIFSWVGGRKPLKRHARDTDGDAAIELLTFFSAWWVDRSVLVAHGRSSSRNKKGRATAMISFEEPPPGYAALWSVAVGAAAAPVATR